MVFSCLVVVIQTLNLALIVSTLTVTLDRMIINRNGLSVTSFSMNFDSNHSDWITFLFGERAVYYDAEVRQNGLGFHHINTSRWAHHNVLNNIVLTEEELHPICSVEILGFGTIRKYEEPFSKHWKYTRPTTGKADLSWNGEHWNCYYRGGQRDLESFWPVFIFCTVKVSEKSKCSNIQNLFQNNNGQAVNATLIFHLVTHDWVTSFPVSTKRSALKENNKNPFALCLPIPYISSDSEKVIANSAIIFEAIRYYSAIGFKVFVYDRGGANYETIFNNSYGNRQITEHFGMNKKVEDVYSLVYHDYGIFELLYPELWARQHKADESNPNEVTGWGDTDKVMSSTQCRFEAKAFYGIDDVIVADADEFLYCKMNDVSPLKMHHTIQSYIATMKQNNIDQATFLQRTLTNTTESPRNCTIDIARSTSTTGSIFDCFAPYRSRYMVKAHEFIKSFHIGHKCPLTSYHEACSNNMDYDCKCHIHTSSNCTMIHLQLLEKVFNTPSRAKIFADHELVGKRVDLYNVSNAGFDHLSSDYFGIIKFLRHDYAELHGKTED